MGLGRLITDCRLAIFLILWHSNSIKIGPGCSQWLRSWPPESEERCHRSGASNPGACCDAALVRHSKV